MLEKDLSSHVWRQHWSIIRCWLWYNGIHNRGYRIKCRYRIHHKVQHKIGLPLNKDDNMFASVRKSIKRRRMTILLDWSVGWNANKCQLKQVTFLACLTAFTAESPDLSINTRDMLIFYCNNIKDALLGQAGVLLK